MQSAKLDAQQAVLKAHSSHEEPGASVTASVSGNKVVGMGEPELFDDVLSAASQVNTRKADTRIADIKAHI